MEVDESHILYTNLKPGKHSSLETEVQDKKAEVEVRQTEPIDQDILFNSNQDMEDWSEEVIATEKLLQGIASWWEEYRECPALVTAQLPDNKALATTFHLNSKLLRELWAA